MKTNISKCVFAAILALAACYGSAQPVMLGEGNDAYIGAVVTGPNEPLFAGQDIVGPTATFDLTNWKVIADQTAKTLTVEIKGVYFDNLLNGTSAGTELGDLFISTSGLVWNTTEESKLDNYYNGTPWNYAVRLNQYNNAGGVLNGEAVQSAQVYTVTPNSPILLADAFYNPLSNTYRSGQEVRLGEVSRTDLVGTASWFISSDEDLLSITINNADALFGSNEVLGFHWTMTCANDVVEFVVPEPSVIGLLAACGLAGALVVRRRLVKSKAA